MTLVERARESSSHLLSRCPKMMLLGGLFFSVGFIAGVGLIGSGSGPVLHNYEKQFAHANTLWEGKDHITGFFTHIQLPEYESLARSNGYTLLEDILRATDDDLRTYLNIQVPAHRKRVLAHSAYICKKLKDGELGCENHYHVGKPPKIVAKDAPAQAYIRFPLWVIAILVISIFANNSKWSVKGMQYLVLLAIYVWFTYRKASRVYTRIFTRSPQG